MAAAWACLWGGAAGGLCQQPGSHVNLAVMLTHSLACVAGLDLLSTQQRRCACYAARAGQRQQHCTGSQVAHCRHPLITLALSTQHRNVPPAPPAAPHLLFSAAAACCSFTVAGMSTTATAALVVVVVALPLLPLAPLLFSLLLAF
jgi:hypothetical protein